MRQAFGLRDEGEGGRVVLGEERPGKELQPLRGILHIGPAVLFYLHAEFSSVKYFTRGTLMLKLTGKKKTPRFQKIHAVEKPTAMSIKSRTRIRIS